MYNNFFGFRERPFNVTPDPRIFYSNPIYQRAYANLLYAICERKKVVVLTGEAGTGKTTLLRRLMKNLEHSVRFAFCPYPTLSFEELLDFVCDDLELPQKPSGQARQLEALQAFLLAQQQQSQYYALLIDEAHNLQLPVLAALTQFTDFMAGDEVLLPIALVGQSELDDTLNHPTVTSLKQAVAIACQLDRLKKSEVGSFIFHRLRTVGCDRQDIFPPDVVDRIAVCAQGIPRSINIICDNALVIACTEARQIVTREIVGEVAKDLQLATSHLPESAGKALSYRPEFPSSERLPVQQSPVVSTFRRQEEKIPSLYAPRFFPQRRRLISRAELSAVGILLFLLLALAYFPAAPKPDAQHGLPRESASAPMLPPPTVPTPQSSPELATQRKSPAPPGLTSQKPTEDPSKRELRQITIATVKSTPAVSNLEQQKGNSDSQRDPFAIEPPARAEKGIPALLPGDTRSQEQQRQEKNERGTVLSANPPMLLAHTARDTSPGGKTTPKAQGATPLTLAVMRGHTAAVEELLKNGASVNEQNVSGRTPLMFAALAGRNAILQALLNNGAAVNATNAEGWTALMYAAWNGHTKVVQTLLRNGAKVDTKSSAGGTALSHALRNGHNETARVLRMGKTGTSRRSLLEKSPATRLSRSRESQPVALSRRSDRR